MTAVHRARCVRPATKPESARLWMVTMPLPLQEKRSSGQCATSAEIHRPRLVTGRARWTTHLLTWVIFQGGCEILHAGYGDNNNFLDGGTHINGDNCTYEVWPSMRTMPCLLTSSRPQSERVKRVVVAVESGPDGRSCFKDLCSSLHLDATEDNGLIFEEWTASCQRGPPLPAE